MATKTISTNFLVAQASALVLNPAEATQMIVRGLTGLTLPLGFEMSNNVISEMGRRIDLVVPSGGAYTPIDITANFVPGDPSQQIFQSAALNSTQLKKMRFYLKQGCDFAALDLINDPGGAYLIGTFSPPSVASKSETYQNQITILPAGSSVLFIAHTPAGGGAALTFNAPVGTGADASIDLSSGSFVDMGFEAGDVVYLDWVNSLAPLCCKIKSGGVAAGALTLEGGVGDCDLVPDFSGIATSAIHGATPIEIVGTDLTCD